LRPGTTLTNSGWLSTTESIAQSTSNRARINNKAINMQEWLRKRIHRAFGFSSSTHFLSDHCS